MRTSQCGIFLQFCLYQIMKPFGVISQAKQAPAIVSEVSIVHPEDVNTQTIVKMPKTQSYAYKQQPKIHVVDRSRNLPNPQPIPNPKPPVVPVNEPIHVIQRRRPPVIKPIKPIKPPQNQRPPVNPNPIQNNQPVPLVPMKPQIVENNYKPQHVDLMEQNERIETFNHQAYHRVYKPPQKDLIDVIPIKNKEIFNSQKVILSEDGSELSQKQSRQHSRLYIPEKNTNINTNQFINQKVTLSEDGSELSIKESGMYTRLYDPQKNPRQPVLPINRKVTLSEDGSVVSMNDHRRYNRVYDPQKQQQQLKLMPPARLSYLLETENYEKRSEPDLASKLSHHRQIKDDEEAFDGGVFLIRQKIALSEDDSVYSMKQSSIYHRTYDPQKSVVPGIPVIPFVKQKVALSQDGSILSENEHARHSRVYDGQKQKIKSPQSQFKPFMISYLLPTEKYEKQSEADLPSKVSHHRQLKKETEPNQPAPVVSPVSPVPPIQLQQVEAVSFPLIEPIILPPLPQTNASQHQVEQIEVINFPPMAPIVF